MRRPAQAWQLATAALLLLPFAALADEFTGAFQGDGLYLELEGDGELYLGAIELGGDIFLCEAQPGGPGLVGTFETDEGSFAFELRAAGGRLVLESGGASYTLNRLETGDPGPSAGSAPSNPLAPGGPGPQHPTDEGATPRRGPGTEPAAPGLAGRWEGSIQGTPSVLTFEERGGSLVGRLDAGGYLYELQGTVAGGRASGQGLDPQTGGGFGFEASARDDLLDFVLVTRPMGAQEQRQRIAFRRSGTAAAPDAGAPPGGGGGQPAPAGPRDPALVGLWRHSESMSGGDASMVVETFLRIDADGTWAMGGGRAVGGGADWGGDTGTGGVEERGYWKSENRIIYVQAPGTGQWQPFARYYLEPGRLMFTFGDGSRQLLYRVQ